MTNKVSSFFNGYDSFGQFMNFEYQGQPTYTTCFGGMISFCFKIFMIVFVSMQIKKMWSKSEWEVSMSDMSANGEAMKILHRMSEE